MSETTSEPKAITVTVATLPASAAERYGERVAARYKVDDEWHEMTYGEIAGDRRGGTRTDRARHRGRRPRLHPGRHARGVDDLQLRHLGGRRGGRPDLPDQLPERVRVGDRQLRGPGGDLREREQRAKIEEIRDELPSLEHVIVIEDGRITGEMSLDELRERGRGGRSRGS